MNSPIVIDLQSTIIKALAPFPEAKKAVVSALRDVELRNDAHKGHMLPPPLPVPVPVIGSIVHEPC